jgi:hypothetical protein
MLQGGALDPVLDQVPPRIDAYTHVKGLSTERNSGSIARQLFSVQLEAQELIGRVHELRRPVRIVIDALDEAVAPREVEAMILRPMRESEPVRLIVSTRVSGRLTPLSDAAEVVDLDDPAFFDQADIVEYVLRRLTAIAQKNPRAASRLRARASSHWI